MTNKTKKNSSSDDIANDIDNIVDETLYVLICTVAFLIWGLIALIMRQRRSNPLNTTLFIFAILGLIIPFAVFFSYPYVNKEAADNSTSYYHLSQAFFYSSLLIGPILTLILVYAVK